MGELIVLMGPTGAGKSSQGDLLAEDLGGVHLSSGKLLRRDPRLAEMIAHGGLAPAELVETIIGEALDAVEPGVPVVLDGFPRTMSNVRWLNEHLGEHGRSLRCVIFLDLDIETSLARLGLRERSDDAPAAVREKWREFEEKTRPVVDYYEEQGLIKHVDGRGTLEEVRQLVKACLA